MILLNIFLEGWKFLKKDLCNIYLMRVLVQMLCEFVSVGFNVGDVQVMVYFFDVCVNLMKVLKMFLYKDILEIYLREKIIVQSIEEFCVVNLYGFDV